MLKNEVGNDGAAPAVERATNNEGLLNEFSSALADSTTLKVVAGTAVLAAGAAATVAAIKYARPALEAGKALSAVADESALAGVRAAVNDGNLAPKAVSATNGRINVDAIDSLLLGNQPMMPATDAILKTSIPISAAARDAAAASLAPATEALVKNSIPITKITRGAEPLPFFGMSDELAARMEYFGLPLKGELPGLDAAAVLRGKPLGHELVPASAHVDRASILAHEVGHRTGINAPLFPSLNDLRSFKDGSGLFRNNIPMSERLGFKEVDPKIPMFPTMDDIVKLIPESGPNMNRVVMNLDGVARDVSVTDAVSILGERAVKFIASNPTGAAKALADRMPKPAMESDIAAMAAKITPAQVNNAVATAIKDGL